MPERDRESLRRCLFRLICTHWFVRKCSHSGCTFFSFLPLFCLVFVSYEKILRMHFSILFVFAYYWKSMFILKTHVHYFFFCFFVVVVIVFLYRIKRSYNPRWVTSFDLNYDSRRNDIISIGIYDEVKPNNEVIIGSAVCLCVFAKTNKLFFDWWWIFFLDSPHHFFELNNSIPSIVVFIFFGNLIYLYIDV